jgi:hypothetical protein
VLKTNDELEKSQKRLVKQAESALDSQLQEERKRLGLDKKKGKGISDQIKAEKELQKLFMRADEQAVVARLVLSAGGAESEESIKQAFKIEGLFRRFVKNMGELTEDQADILSEIQFNFSKLSNIAVAAQQTAEVQGILEGVNEALSSTKKAIDDAALSGLALQKNLVFEEYADAIDKAAVSGVNLEGQLTRLAQLRALAVVVQDGRDAEVSLQDLLSTTTAVGVSLEDLGATSAVVLDGLLARMEAARVVQLQFTAEAVLAADLAKQRFNASKKGLQDEIELSTKLSTIRGVLNEQARASIGEQAGIAAGIAETSKQVVDFEQNLQRLRFVDDLKEVAGGIGDAFGEAFEEIITGSKSASDAALDFAAAVTRILLRKFATEPLVNALISGLGALGEAGGTALASANGNAFNGGEVVPFARGGIIGSPTTFPLGLAGEAGPEAILPLQRGSDGKLGVSVTSRPSRGGPGDRAFVSHAVSQGASNADTASEMRGGSRVNNTVLNIQTPDASSFRRSRRQISQQLRAAGGR